MRRGAGFSRFLPPAGALLALAALCAAGPAGALDCTRAATATEKAICADGDLKAADERMAAAYAGAENSLAGTAQSALRHNQRSWIARREALCGYHDMDGDAESLAACVLEMTQARAALLEGAPQAGPGTGTKLEPYFVLHQGGKTGYAVEIAVQRFGAPQASGERAFNEAVDALIAAAPTDETVDFDPPGQLSYELDMQVAYASPRLVSAQAHEFRYDGGAHPNSNTVSINADPQGAGLLRFADIFRSEADAHATLAAACRAQIVNEKRSRIDDEAASDEAMSDYEDAIRDGTADLALWTFHGDRTVIRFDAYEVGSYAEGPYECVFGYDLLAPLARDAAMLPR